MARQKGLVTVLIFLSSIAQAGQNDLGSEAALRINHVLESSVTGEEYRLFVSLPQTYRDSIETQYPVVYVLDINTEDSLQLGQYHELASQLPNVPDFILVGVGFLPDDEHLGLRTAHFSPTSNEAEDKKFYERTISTIESRNIKKAITPEMIDSWRSGRGDEFSKVIETELLPFITRNYQTSGSSSIVGASLAGLFLTVQLFESPELFDNHIITSPSLWWNEFEVFDDPRRFFLNRDSLPGRVYLSVGSLENKDMYDSYQRLKRIFQEGGYKSLEFSAEIIENENHISVIPISFMRGLQYVFSTAPN